MAPISPTQRTLAECKKRGWRAGVVEKWNPHAGIRQDLFGFVDLVALDPEAGQTILIQATASGVSDRVKKIREKCRDAALDCLKAGNRIVVWGWRKTGAAGKRKLWNVREVEITEEDLFT